MRFEREKAVELDGQRVIALAGTPNVGKSTLFNSLTGMRRHTGNWSGKTVGVGFGLCKGRESEYLIADLPGSYSPEEGSQEERIAGDFIRSGQASLTAVMCDGGCIERGVALALRLREQGARLLLCVNLLDEARRKGLEIDLKLLEKRLGLPVIGMVARKKNSRERFIRAVDEALGCKETPEKEKTTEACSDEEAFRMAEELCRGVARPIPGMKKRPDWGAADRMLTGVLGYPLMLLMLLGIFWLTICGANYPSRLLSAGLFRLEELMTAGLSALGAPGWLVGLLCQGAYRTLAWVVAVMLPPMAIFFPLFTILEDAGFLPRAAFDLDSPFRACGSCGKQALCMCMGLGCNAAGVVGCRIIDTKRERLLAILTNCFTPCNGRFPGLIALTTIFFGAGLGGVLPAAVLTGFILLGAAVTLAVTKLLSVTLLRGEQSPFILELPPYRMPRFGQVLLRSLLDRTLAVLGRAAAVAAPAGALLWCLANIQAGGQSLLSHGAQLLDPAGRLLGMDGAILLGFILGFPANEIVLPVILMIYCSGGSLIELGELASLGEILRANGWTAATAVCVMLFSLMHWPCSTTLLTIKKETGSRGWTALAALIPTLAGVAACILTSFITGR